MHHPGLEEFVSKTKQGNLIPIYKDILADLETPVSAYLKVGQGPFSFLLESVEGGEKWARYCFLGCDSYAVVILNGKRVTLRTKREEKSWNIKGDVPLDALKEILKPYKPVEDPNLPRFFGGAVGFISYDMVRFFEKLPDITENDLGLPDAIFVITETLLIFDNVGKKIKIVCNAHINGENIDEIYKDSIQKIDYLENKLRQGVPKNIFPKNLDFCKESIPFESNFKKDDFKKAVLKAKEYICEGDIIQTVLSQRLKFKITQDPFTVYRALRIINPSPYMYFLNFEDYQIVGASPEVLVRLEGDQVESRPIAGTRPRGEDNEEDKALERELLADEKERAEHIMLVDLGRNDLGRISEIGTVDVNERFLIERYSHVMHIVSNVRGVLKEGKDCYDVLQSTFPAGTLSGAPKVRAMEIIEELEPTRRGVYGGAVGYISFNGNMDTAIAIRTLLIKGKFAYLGVGAGIVADSDPEREFEETINKGKALLAAINLGERGLEL